MTTHTNKDRLIAVARRLTEEGRFVAAVQEGLRDDEAGRVISHEELGRRLDARYGALVPRTK